MSLSPAQVRFIAQTAPFTEMLRRATEAGHCGRGDDGVSDLTEFLLARIIEDEKAARVSCDAAHPQESVYCGPEGHPDRRRLAECEAKRRIMEALDYTPCPCQRADRCVLHDASAGPPDFARERFLDPATEAVLHALALPYADHPDYREEWRP